MTTKKHREADTDENTKRKDQPHEPSKPWWQVIRQTIGARSSSGYWQNFVISVALALIAPVVGIIMQSRKAIVIGAGCGVTILLWILIIAFVRRIPEEPKQSPASTDNQVETLGEMPPTQKGDLMPEKTPNSVEQPHAISQTMTNSPGGIQAGGNVTISQGPQPRRLTADQQAFFTAFLRSNGKGSIDIACLENGGPEPCAFARQLVDLLKSSGWTISSFTPMIGFGDPTKTIPEMYLLVKSNQNPPMRAIVLQQALRAVGYEATGFERPDQDADFLQLTVAPKQP